MKERILARIETTELNFNRRFLFSNLAGKPLFVSRLTPPPEKEEGKKRDGRRGKVVSNISGQSCSAHGTNPSIVAGGIYFLHVKGCYENLPLFSLDLKSQNTGGNGQRASNTQPYTELQYHHQYPCLCLVLCVRNSTFAGKSLGCVRALACGGREYDKATCHEYLRQQEGPRENFKPPWHGHLVAAAFQPYPSESHLVC